MQGQSKARNANNNNQKSKNIPITLVTAAQECDSCPTALSAYKILCDLSATNTCSNNCIDITHETLASGLKRTPQKSMCALNCLERMGFIKIIHLENPAKGCSTNKIELMQDGQFLRKSA
jgi:hypothetical protein